MGLTLSFLFCIANADDFAVLVAGSNGYYNYRHQADIAHAYQVLTKEGGIPAENIITMMYDDVAHSDENPIQGNLINHINGTNVYMGKDVIDYRKEECNADNVLGVLNGTAKGKTLKSTSEDNVFFYFADHGAAGLVAMPVGDPLYAVDFLKTIHWMHDNHKYKQMVIYIEACESGSMLENLPNDINIFGTTAARDNESSYATYFDKSRGTYLGDEYSVSWMEDSDRMYSSKDTQETLQTQFLHVKKNVNQSHPQEFGSRAIRHEQVRVYQGNATEIEGSSWSFFGWLKQKLQHIFVPRRRRTLDEEGLILVSDSRDVKLNTLKNLYNLAPEVEKAHFYALMMEEEKDRALFDKTFTYAVKTFKMDERFLTERMYDEIDFQCLKHTYRQFEKKCKPFSDYGLKYVRTLANLCSEFDKHKITAIFEHFCKH